MLWFELNLNLYQLFAPESVITGTPYRIKIAVFYVYHSDAIVVNQYEIDFDFGSVGLRPMRVITSDKHTSAWPDVQVWHLSRESMMMTFQNRPAVSHQWSNLIDNTCEFSSNSASRIYTLELDLNQLKFWIHDTRFCEYHQKQLIPDFIQLARFKAFS